MPPPDILKFLADSSNYEIQIERLLVKRRRGDIRSDLEEEGVSLTSFSHHRTEISKVIARSVLSGSYEFRPATMRPTLLEDKIRELYFFSLTDRIVHGVISDFLMMAMKPLISTQLYSYQRGKNWAQALEALVAYIKRHHRDVRELRKRGFYVLRRDIASYSDSIPIGDSSKIWDLLERVLRSCRGPVPNCVYNIIRSVIRPSVLSDEGNLYTLVKGIPTGSPICTVIYNLYLLEVDRAFAAIPGAFYARYSDDIFFAHCDPKVVQSASETLVKTLDQYGLMSNASKVENIYFNGAARSCPLKLSFRGSDKVTLLGCSIRFNGVVGLKPKILSRLFADLDRRVARSLRLLARKTVDERGVVVCSLLNKVLEGKSVSSPRGLSRLLAVVTDRSQLKDCDYRLARIVLKNIYGDASVKMFRKTPYKKMRKVWGLKSLLHVRNKQRD